MKRANCVFCAIAAGDEPASVAYEDEKVMAIMSLDQPTSHKVLVVPKVHAETLFDLADIEAGALLQVAVRVGRAVREASACEGLNLIQSNGTVAGQDVDHFHMHLVPRRRNDDVVLQWPDRQVGREQLDGMAAEIRSKLKADLNV